MMRAVIIVAVMAWACPVDAQIARVASCKSVISGGAATDTTNECTLTPSGSDRILLAGHQGALSDTSTGCTFGPDAGTRTAMTLVSGTSDGKVAASGNRWIYLYYLLAPAAALGYVDCTTSGGTAQQVFAVTYSGAEQEAPEVTAEDDTDTSTTTAAQAITPATGNSWIVMFARSGSGGTLSGNGSPATIVQEGNGTGLLDSNSAIGTVSTTMTVSTSAAAGNWGLLLASFAPSAAAAGARSLLTLGVGGGCE